MKHNEAQTQSPRCYQEKPAYLWQRQAICKEYGSPQVLSEIFTRVGK